MHTYNKKILHNDNDKTTQLAFTFSKLAIETLEQGMEVRSSHKDNRKTSISCAKMDYKQILCS